MKLKPLIITIPIIVTIGISSFSFADNYVFRHAFQNTSGNVSGEGDNSNSSPNEESKRVLRSLLI